MVFLRPKPAELKVSKSKIPKVTMAVLVLFLVISLVVGLFPGLVVDKLGLMALATLIL